MSQFYDQASLVMVPSGYKDGKLYSQKPLSTSGELSFSRGSDIEATRVASNGYIEKAQVNLLLQSNTFSTTWVNVATTETGGQADKDGGTSAWKLEASSGGSSRVIGQTNALTGVCTFSVYAKAGNISYLALENGTQFTYASLIDGTQGNNSGLIDYAATSVGNGWWRISIVFNKAASSDLRIYLASSNTSSVVSSGDYIYIQDAQLNYGLVAQTYQETTTAAVVSGITDNMPRLNYDPANPTCPSLLLEPSRTNLITQSEFFEDASWLDTDLTITSNYGISPEGVQNSTRLVLTNLTSSRIAIAPTLVDGTTYTFSCYYKGTAGEKLYMEGNGNGGSGTLVSKLITFTGDWQREELQFVGGSTSNLAYIVDTRNGTEDTAQDFEVYGAQLEAGNYPTSYIPTYGTSATRTADACSKTGIASLIGQSEGTVFLEVDYSTLSGLDMFLSIRPNASNKVEVYRDGGTIYGDLTASSSFALSASKAVGTHKIAFAYKSGSSALYIDGILIDQNTTSFTFSASLANLYINQRSGGLFIEAANYKQALLFTQRLPNSDLATLTSL